METIHTALAYDIFNALLQETEQKRSNCVIVIIKNVVFVSFLAFLNTYLFSYMISNIRLIILSVRPIM